LAEERNRRPRLDDNGMIFKPHRSLTGWQGLLVCLALLALDAWFTVQVARRPLDGVSFLMALAVLLSLPLLAYIAYRTYGAFTLEYWVDRDGVTIIWGPTRHLIPMGDIIRIVRGDADGSRRWWHWPAPWVSQRKSGRFGIVRSFATQPPAAHLLLVTEAGAYSVTPAQPERFLAALQARHLLGRARVRRPLTIRPPLRDYPLWRDRLGLGLLGAGFLLNLALFGLLSWRFPTLPADLPLHFDAAGQPDRIGTRSALFILPTLGLLAWLTNTAWGIWQYRRQRLASYLLWGGAAAVQVLALVALRGLGV